MASREPRLAASPGGHGVDGHVIDDNVIDDNVIDGAPPVGESAPLLRADPPSGAGPDVALRRLVVAMCLVFLFIVEVSVFIMEPPTQEIMEAIICRSHFPDHALRGGGDDARCKSTGVQKTLAMVRSWTVSAEMVVPAVRHRGRQVRPPHRAVPVPLRLRPPDGLVLRFPDVFSIWAMLYGCVALVIGGGGQMAVAMVWTILADVLPVADRTAVFYQLQAMMLLLAVVVNPLTALLLSIDPWIAVWLGFGILVVGMLTSLLVPETLGLHREADRGRRRGYSLDDDDDGSVLPKGGLARRAWCAVRNDMVHVWRFILGSRRIMMLVAAYGLFFPVKLNLSVNILQYMTKRFNWKWSTTSQGRGWMLRSMNKVAALHDEHSTKMA